MGIFEILLIVVILALAAGFISMLYFYLKISKKLEQAEKELGKDYLERAKIEANQIVKKAGEQAENVLSTSRTVSDKDKAILEAAVRQIASDQTTYLKQSMDQIMQEFGKQLEQIKNYNVSTLTETSKNINSTTSLEAKEYAKAVEQVKVNIEKLMQDFTIQMQQVKTNDINTLTNISKDIEKTAATEIDKYTKVLEQETIQSENLVKKKIDDQYAKVAAEIENYKTEQFKKIEESLNVILTKISMEVLEKSFNVQDHKDLIIRTLEKAKHENILN
jgi:hypothetical protein